MITWLHKNRKWVFSGIGVAVLTTALALISHWISKPPTSEPATNTVTTYQETHGSGSPAIANTQGDVKMDIKITSPAEEVKTR